MLNSIYLLLPHRQQPASASRRPRKKPSELIDFLAPVPGGRRAAGRRMFLIE
jgi:hypothetical protein